MTISYALAATSAMINSGATESLAASAQSLESVKDGDLMVCVTLANGTIMTIPAAYLRITGPRQLRGLFDAHIGERFESDVMYTLNADNIAMLDYFVM